MTQHHTVFLEEAVAALAIKPAGTYLDCTYGRGGHTKMILAQLNGEGQLYSCDRDPEAELSAREINDQRFHFVRSNFSQLDNFLPRQLELDGVLMDLGISSPQVDRAERGFSFNKAGPIDMRMNNQVGPTAQELLASYDEKKLADIIRDYGGEPHTIARRIAWAIKAALPLKDTLALAEVVSAAVPKKYHKKNQHPATQTFQALRIAVNDEFTEIENALAAAVPRLKKEGTLVVISFHSDEDALVKRFLRKYEGETLPPELPISGKINQQLKMVGSPLRPSEEAVRINPRARSALLRKAIKL